MTKTKTDEIVKATGVDVAELASYRSQATELVDFLRTVVADTPEKEAWASARLSDVRALKKVLEDNRKALKAPLLEAGRRVDGLFKPSISPLDEAEVILRRILTDAAQNRMLAEHHAMKLAEASVGDDVKVMQALAMVPDAVQTSGSSVSFEWVAEVVDFGQLSDSYKMVDEAKLAGVGRAAKAAGTEPSTPGVKWTKQAKVRAK